ncbi:MAG TPA: hypothetical protein VJ885_19845 [Thermoanaerobaculia bacterium]|nr:hypothetical protein [Thermoanaerobaculia bacterium]
MSGTSRKTRGAVLALAVLLALWVDLSAIHRYHNSDSLIPVLMSLDRWTPFYWEQNRFGMLVPLLALPFQEPFQNLLVQVGLRLFALFLSFFLLARIAVPRPWWPAVGGLTLALFLMGKDPAQHNFQQMQPYFQALSLALGGILLIERPAERKHWGWLAAGGALIALAFWVSLETLLWLAPLLALRRIAFASGEPRRWGRELFPLALLAVCFGASLIASRLSPYQGTNLGFAPPAVWPRGWQGLLSREIDYLGPVLPWAIAALLVLAALFALARKGWARPVLASGLCLLGTAAAHLLILGTSGWVHQNDLRVRFLAVGLLAAATAGPALLLGLFLEGRPERWTSAVNAAVLLALLPLTFLRYGAPSPAVARAALDDLGPAGEWIAAAGCTHVLGDYWKVWPAVFRANLELEERGEEGRVWGIARRSTQTVNLWRPSDWSAARIAVLGTQRQAESLRAFFRIPLPGSPGGPATCGGREGPEGMISLEGIRPGPPSVPGQPAGEPSSQEPGIR